VRAYFADAPVMIEIARCESKFRQYADTGNPLYGGAGGKMVGVFQIYEDIHGDVAKQRGMDLATLDGNMQYANHLYEREGTKPWISSFPCWGSELNKHVSDAPADALTMNLSLGMEHPQVLLLQKTLNTKGYMVTNNGPGSPGNETQKFGALTRAAVRRFQCENMQICSGDEYSTGYGYVGTKTRAALSGASTASVAASAGPALSSSNQSEMDGYTSEQQQQIANLKAHIVELTHILNALLAAR
jgi:hypothetical protein